MGGFGYYRESLVMSWRRFSYFLVDYSIELKLFSIFYFKMKVELCGKVKLIRWTCWVSYEVLCICVSSGIWVETYEGRCSWVLRFCSWRALQFWANVKIWERGDMFGYGIPIGVILFDKNNHIFLFNLNDKCWWIQYKHIGRLQCYWDKRHPEYV